MLVRVTSEARVRERGVRDAGGAGLKVTRDCAGILGAGGIGFWGQQTAEWCEQMECPHCRVVGAERVRLQTGHVRRWMSWFMGGQAYWAGQDSLRKVVEIKSL